MPLGLPKEFGLLGHVFTDFGSAWSFDTNTAPPNSDVVKDINAIRLSVGYGFSWQSPLGPLRLDLAMPIIKQAFDKKEFFRVGFGSNF
jgi:outer membrane protein insertion porin family